MRRRLNSPFIHLVVWECCVLIRAEKEKDRAAVRALNLSAFETPAEADLVDALREQAQPVISLVAEGGDAIIGHILFSPVTLHGNPELKMMGLAPMAVLTAHRSKGIGSALIRVGLEQCRQLGFGAVVVLGHPGYYPCFGFSPAVRFSIGCEYNVPEEAFMLMELQPGYIRGISGVIKYHDAFSKEG
jgi:putative acetyltransferase